MIYFLSCTLTKLCVFIFNLHFCSGIFLTQTFESCGIFLLDFQPYNRQQGDFIHEALEHLHLNQSRPTSLIIKTKLYQKEIHPEIFRSMKYDCFFYVHINFGKDLFSTIPSFENPFQRPLYTRALFIIFVKGNARKMMTIESSKLQRNRQYTIIVLRLAMNRQYIQYISKLFAFDKIYFFCSFCERGLILLNSLSLTKILSLKLFNFEKNWANSFAEHFDDVPIYLFIY